jgi:putative SOS response-associated peptidase YedK
VCGRYVLAQSDDDLIRMFQVDEAYDDAPPPSWNVAPTDPVRAVLTRESKDAPGSAHRQLRTVRWGLVPSWAKDRSIGARLINARSETITEKASFKAAAARRRCLIPADGYYEWEKRDGVGAKVPNYLHLGGETLVFAGLYELWPDPAKERDDPERWLWTVTIVTAPASDALGHIHDRTPVLIPAGAQADWLDPGMTSLEGVRDLLASLPEPSLEPLVVGSAVNSVRNNGPALIEPADVEFPVQETFPS